MKINLVTAADAELRPPRLHPGMSGLQRWLKAELPARDLMMGADKTNPNRLVVKTRNSHDPILEIRCFPEDGNSFTVFGPKREPGDKEHLNLVETKAQITYLLDEAGFTAPLPAEDEDEDVFHKGAPGDRFYDIFVTDRFKAASRATKAKQKI